MLSNRIRGVVEVTTQSTVDSTNFSAFSHIMSANLFETKPAAAFYNLDSTTWKIMQEAKIVTKLHPKSKTSYNFPFHFQIIFNTFFVLFLSPVWISFPHEDASRAELREFVWQKVSVHKLCKLPRTGTTDQFSSFASAIILNA
jgi:hypothetical protein